MIVFLDTNIALDFLLKREDFFEDAKKVIALCLNRGYPLYLSSVSFANISYIARKGCEGKNVNELMAVLRDMVNVSPSTQDTVDMALSINPKDFEDAMQFFSASAVSADMIVTRNTCDFQTFSIRAVTPKDFLKSII